MQIHGADSGLLASNVECCHEIPRYCLGTFREEDLGLLRDLIWSCQSPCSPRRTLDRIEYHLRVLLPLRASYCAAFIGGVLVAAAVGCDHDLLSCGSTPIPPKTFYLSDGAVLPGFRRRRLGTGCAERLLDYNIPPYEFAVFHTAADAPVLMPSWRHRRDKNGRMEYFADAREIFEIKARLQGLEFPSLVPKT